MSAETETICAIATPAGRGGVGIVRISGTRTVAIAKAVLGELPKPRYAHHGTFKGEDGAGIDKGLALYFKAPHSFTGEDVLELHAHGGPVVLELLVERVTVLGARQARPGEFSERAFLNNKLDLVQAEAIADVIDSHTKAAAKAASRSLQGAFSRRINALVEQIIQLRTFIEAALDFPDEEIEWLENAGIATQIETLSADIDDVVQTASQGRLLREGFVVVLAGPPNAGKSSLLNALAQTDAAIVTDIPGTTRDTLREQIQIAGMPVHVIDTAGLRETGLDAVETEGIRRARAAMADADQVLFVVDQSAPEPPALPQLELPVTVVHNKIDLSNETPAVRDNEVWLSAKTGAGLDGFRDYLAQIAGLQTQVESPFSARSRHIDALKLAQQHTMQALDRLNHHAGAELVAEELRLAQAAMGEITGVFTSDDLLGRIFGSFCIGK